MSRKSIKDRFMEKVSPEPNSGCWLWTGSISRSTGYGFFYFPPKLTNAHRASYRLFVGDIPPDKHVCHRCDNRACVNPGHLFVGSMQDNMDDRGQKGRTVRGEQHGKCSIPDSVVQSIRLEYASGGTSHKKLAMKYGISKTQAGNIVRGEQRT